MKRKRLRNLSMKKKSRSQSLRRLKNKPSQFRQNNKLLKLGNKLKPKMMDGFKFHQKERKDDLLI